ncbi:MAG TPA: hypothetical protein VFV11_09310, partial [Solimonas sp.]|nr:hypothetical protein [Solimonas sp.]
VPLIQVSHGAGLGGNSLQHGFAMHSNEEYWDAVVPKMKRARISTLLIPGLGTMKELQSAYDHGVRSVHVATHCTEADTSPQHIAYARKLGMDTTGFLMMAHLNDAKGLAEQGKLMESYGAQTIYITDSAGYMLPSDVIELRRDLDHLRGGDLLALGVHAVAQGHVVHQDLAALQVLELAHGYAASFTALSW